MSEVGGVEAARVNIFTHPLRPPQAPRNLARIARRAAAALHRNALVLAVAQQIVHHAHSPVLVVHWHLPAVQRGVSLLRKEDRPEHRASGRPVLCQAHAATDRLFQELHRLGVRVLAGRPGEELDALIQRAVGHPVEEMASLAETVGPPILAQWLGWERRRLCRSRGW